MLKNIAPRLAQFAVEDPIAKYLFHAIRSRERNRKELSVQLAEEMIKEVLLLMREPLIRNLRQEVIRIFKRLDAMGIATYRIGRRSKPTRLIWKAAPQRYAIAALGPRVFAQRDLIMNAQDVLDENPLPSTHAASTASAPKELSHSETSPYSLMAAFAIWMTRIDEQGANFDGQDVLVMILKCMRKWGDELQRDPAYRELAHELLMKFQTLPPLDLDNVSDHEEPDTTDPWIQLN